MLRLERAEVLEPLFQRLEDNRAAYNAVANQMHDLQRQLDELHEEGGKIEDEIDRENRYYHQGEMEMVHWPNECKLKPAPATLRKTRAEARTAH